MNLIRNWVRLTPERILVNGEKLDHHFYKGALVTELYKTNIRDYPKFYKMDPLCKVGFVASELLLKAEQSEREEWGEERAVVLFNSTSSLADDKKYQETIEDLENFFPSPSVFVYTLPNVLTGEICIRNKYYGESNFIVMEKNAQYIANTLRYIFDDDSTQSVLTGWVDCLDENHFDVAMFLIGRSMLSNQQQLINEINIIFNK